MTGSIDRPPAAESVQLGLEQLSAEEIATLGNFVLQSASEDTQQRYRTELEALLNSPEGREPDEMAQLLETLSGDPRNSRTILQLACQAVAGLAEREPAVGFTLWRKLAGNQHPEIRDGARDSLVASLGVRELDPKGVVGVIKAYSEVRSPKRRRTGPQAEEADSTS